MVFFATHHSYHGGQLCVRRKPTTIRRKLPSSYAAQEKASKSKLYSDRTGERAMAPRQQPNSLGHVVPQ